MRRTTRYRHQTSRRPVAPCPATGPEQSDDPFPDISDSESESRPANSARRLHGRTPHPPPPRPGSGLLAGRAARQHKRTPQRCHEDASHPAPHATAHHIHPPSRETLARLLVTRLNRSASSSWTHARDPRRGAAIRLDVLVEQARVAEFQMRPLLHHGVAPCQPARACNTCATNPAAVAGAPFHAKRQPPAPPLSMAREHLSSKCDISSIGAEPASVPCHATPDAD
ncbi:Hypothetical protein PFR_JS7-2_372 [Propionibacterium freudenreichii]|nr:Hypothetical protein PFR_JS7-1_372 [Propionibacterium freudenreichii]SCQ49455.1 Hypothetical protein PFR_JS7-2_372 [Propionibacterium freudenreichii]